MLRAALDDKLITFRELNLLAADCAGTTYTRCRRLKHAIHIQSRSSGSLWARP